ncbi:hypothetical protein [Actinomadura terrae]|uniref:hypothetical protein n=1 Tax=Actinomadura terrae TaxID=604353 RepID=UPI001FA7C76A|nr:hypothetical protein [Actinomadura terrae]
MGTYEEDLAEKVRELRTRTGKKRAAQDLLMHGIGVVLGYWTENEDMTVAALGGEDSQDVDEFAEILKREADRIAHLFGFDEAWSN